jgi:hypothetical protein
MARGTKPLYVLVGGFEWRKRAGSIRRRRRVTRSDAVKAAAQMLSRSRGYQPNLNYYFTFPEKVDTYREDGLPDPPDGTKSVHV